MRRALQGFSAGRPFIAGAADAAPRLTDLSGVVHDVQLHGFVIGG